MTMRSILEVLFRSPLKSSESPVYRIGGKILSQIDAMAGARVTGEIGSGKTTSATLPWLEDVIKNGGYSKRGKTGGLAISNERMVLESILWFAHSAGRNVLQDIVPILSDPFIPIVELRDEADGRLFYVSGLDFGRGSEFQTLLSGMKDVHGNPLDGGALTDDLHTEIFEALETHLLGVVIDVFEKKPKYLGLRWVGSNLVRVPCGSDYEESFQLNQTLSAPKQLRYVRCVRLENLARCSLIRADLSPVQNARRLALSFGAQFENGPFFANATECFLANCFQSWALAFPANPTPTISNVLELATGILGEHADIPTQDDVTAGLLSNLNSIAESSPANTSSDNARSNLKYFTVTKNLSQNTRAMILSSLRNAFGSFAIVPTLGKAFEQPSSISLGEMETDGKFFVFAACRRQSSEVIGRLLHYDFIMAAQQRADTASREAGRSLALLLDGASTYLPASRATVDLPRVHGGPCRVLRMDTDLSDAQVVYRLGECAAHSYFQQFGVHCWLRNSDKLTNGRASTICGLKYSGKYSNSRNKYAAPKPYLLAEEFAGLAVLESITFSAATHGSGVPRIERRKGKPHPLFDPAMVSKLEDFMRWYSQAFAEMAASRARVVYVDGSFRLQ